MLLSLIHILETGKRALDFLMEQSKGRRNLEVDFFGGEPLMNFEVVKELVRYARQQETPRHKRFRFTLTTNGMLLDDDVMEFGNREMSNVVLSLDGRREVHDHLRKDYAGQGSYDRIVPKFQEFVRRRGGKNYYIRGTFTPVSYTHLDVYKRQPLCHLRQQLHRERMVVPKTAQRKGIALQGIQGGALLSPVRHCAQLPRGGPGI